MATNDLKQKLCKGLDDVEDDAFRKVEKVLTPFLRNLKRRKDENIDVIDKDFEELYLKKTQVELHKNLQEIAKDPVRHVTLLNETAELLKVVTKSKSVNLYLVIPERNELLLCPKYVQNDPRHEKRYKIGTYLAAHVAHTKEYVISSDILGDVRFPLGIPDVAAIKSALCVPVIINEENYCIAVVELYRDCSDRPYDLTNLQICTALTGWMGVAIQENKLKNKCRLQMGIQEQISTIANSYFSTLIPFTKVVADIVVTDVHPYASGEIRQSLAALQEINSITSCVGLFQKVTKIAATAEKGAFYVFHEPVTRRTEEPIFADAYEEADADPFSATLYKKGNKVRFVKNEPGIAGYVARTGEIVNIRDAYKDPRFDKKTDSPFVRTRSVVGFPIKNNHGVIAVLLLINNMNHHYFREQDSELVKSFLTQISLICSHFLLENFFIKTEYRLIVTDKLLDYHMKPTNEEVNAIKTALQQEITLPEEFFSFEYDLSVHEEDSCKFITYLFLNVDFLSSYFETIRFIHFILRVKKSYRPIMFHNFEHAFSVFHCALTLIIKTKDLSEPSFKPLEIIAMLLSAICHDVGHFGLTNNFISLKNDAIYKLYGDFCGEAHRYNLAVFILSQSEALINMSTENYDTIIEKLKKFILGFDMTFHFQYKRQLFKIINDNKFDWDTPEHRFLVQHIMLMTADYSYNFKNFEHAKKETYQYYKELHQQGDMENMMGFNPTVMMDRNKADLIPENQKILLTVVVLPCVQLLGRLFPVLTNLETLLQQTLDKWNEIIVLRGMEMWNLNAALFKERRERRTRRVTLTSTLSSIRTISSESKIFFR